MPNWGAPRLNGSRLAGSVLPMNTRSRDTTTSRDTDAKCRGVSCMDVNEFSLRGEGAYNAAA